jgi:hypothetical protein
VYSRDTGRGNSREGWVGGGLALGVQRAHAAARAVEYTRLRGLFGVVWGEEVRGAPQAAPAVV